MDKLHRWLWWSLLMAPMCAVAVFVVTNCHYDSSLHQKSLLNTGPDLLQLFHNISCFAPKYKPLLNTTSRQVTPFISTNQIYYFCTQQQRWLKQRYPIQK